MPVAGRLIVFPLRIIIFYYKARNYAEDTKVKLKHTVWNICIRPKADGLIAGEPGKAFRKIKNPPFGWAADPFAAEENGVLYIFAENMRYKADKGSIGCCTYDGKRFSKWETVLEEPFHLAYPNIFKLGDGWYMMPDSDADGSVCLYRARNFPYGWEKIKTLYRGENLADTTDIGGGMYLSYIHSSKEYRILEKTEDGDLEEIFAGPDAGRCLRPAGKAFEYEGRTVVPTQDGSRRYGGGIVLNGLLSAGRDGLETEEMVTVGPGDIEVRGCVLSRPDGLHTYNFSENYEITDIRRERFIPSDVFFRGLRKFRKDTAYRKYSHESACLVKCAELDDRAKWTELLCSSERHNPEDFWHMMEEGGFDLKENLKPFYEILSEGGRAKDGKIHVLVCTGGLPKSGAAEMLVNLARYAHGFFDFHYVIYSGKRNDYAEELERLGASLHTIPERRNGRMSFYRRIGRVMDKYGIKTVVTSEKNLSGLVLGFAFLKGAEIRISYPHDTGAAGDGTMAGRIKIAAMRLTTRIFATGVFACCEAAGEWKIGEKAFRRSGTVIKNGIECRRYRYSGDSRARIRSRLGLDTDSFVIGNVAYLSKLKNQEFLIELMPEILKRKPEAFLLLCGGDDWENIGESLKKKAEEMKISDRIIFEGLTENTEEYYSAMDVFALPSLREAAPLTLIEAQANGLPCVVSCYVPEETDLHVSRN